jgi:hypothetical protein
VLRNCITGEEVIAPRKNAAIGDIVSATGDTTDCYEVISYTSSSSRDGISNGYEDCLECFKDEFTGVIFQTCSDDNTRVTLTAATSTLTFLPDPSSVYYMTFSGVSAQYVGCFEFVSFTNATNQYRITNVGTEYTSCYNCSVVNIPSSAGTIYYSCVICDTTATTVNPPHPVYSNMYGQGNFGLSDKNVFSYFGPATSPDSAIYDNVKNFFQRGLSQTHNISLEYGKKKTSWRFSGSAFMQDGVVPNNTFNRYNLRLSNTTKIGKYIDGKSCTKKLASNSTGHDRHSENVCTCLQPRLGHPW